MNFPVLLMLVCIMLATTADAYSAQSRGLKSQFLFFKTHYNDWIDNEGQPIKRPVKSEIFARMKYQVEVGAITTGEGDAIVAIMAKYPRKIPANVADLMREALKRPAPVKVPEVEAPVNQTQANTTMPSPGDEAVPVTYIPGIEENDLTVPTEDQIDMGANGEKYDRSKCRRRRRHRKL